MVGSVERTMYFEFYVSNGLFISKKILTQEERGDSEGKRVGSAGGRRIQRYFKIKGLPVECIINMLSGSQGLLWSMGRLKDIA